MCHSCHIALCQRPVGTAYLFHFFSLSFSWYAVWVFRSTCPSRLPGVAYIEPSLFWNRLGGTLEASACVSGLSEKDRVLIHTPFLTHSPVLLRGARLNGWRATKFGNAVSFLRERVVIDCPLGSKGIFGGIVCLTIDVNRLSGRSCRVNSYFIGK